jgi:CheY-like chemotaxis protein
VEADRGQISQAFLNLFVNASQAMPSGGSITVETKDIHLHEEFVRMHQVKPGKFVKVTVTDTGNGMDEATRQRIFDPFFTTKSRERGTGLGLASVYGIIKNHGGIVTVKSDKGRGTTFTVFLPASDKAARLDRAQTMNAVRGEGTILLVDDEKMVIEAGRLMLQSLGYTVLTAYNGLEALSIYKARQTDIDLVLLDIIMPGMDGSEVLQIMRTINPEVKILLASGYSLEHQTQKTLGAGCAGFIQKPFSLKALSVKIQECLTKGQ